jgi:hypothetical protein
MINKLIEKYKRLVEENYDEDNCFADLSKVIVYQEIIQDLQKIKEPTICGYSAEEVITILNALELERILDIKVTMENLGILSEKLQKDFQDTLNKSMSDMIKSLGVDKDE